jgi:hypothetical protein
MVAIFVTCADATIDLPDGQINAPGMEAFVQPRS